MLAKDFNYDRYHDIFDEKQENLRKFMRGEWKGPLLMQSLEGKVYDELANRKEDSLSGQLDNLTAKMDLRCDYTYSFLEPWCGVGVYANIFGAHLHYFDHSAVQTTPRYLHAEEVQNIPEPDISKCELVQVVKDYIRYFREQTGDQLPIVLTDTQSPNDTASLILDPVELFMASITEPELIEDFLWKVTKVIGDFTEEQIELIGPCYHGPGHQFPSDAALPGISLSDDNLAVISPESWIASARPYNDILARRFGGIALHSCGVFSHSMSELKASEDLNMLNFKISDFEPNDPSLLAETFAGTDTILHPIIFPGEPFERLLPLMRDDLKVIINLATSGTIEEKNAQYDQMEAFFRPFRE